MVWFMGLIRGVDGGGTFAGAGVGRRALGTILSQCLASLTNFAILFAALRQFDIGNLGTFTLIYTSALTVTAVGRSLIMQPIVVHHAVDGSTARATAVSSAFGFIAVAGFLLTSLLWLARVMFGTNHIFALCALVSTCLLLQDSWRYYFIISGSSAKAAVNDLVRLLATIGGVFVLGGGSVGLDELVLSWFVGAGVALTVAYRQSDIRPTLAGTKATMTFIGRTGSVFAADDVIERLAAQAAIVVVGIFGGASVLGRIGAARTLISPVTTLTSAVDLFLLPESARQLASSSPKSMQRLNLRVSAVLGLSVGFFTLLLTFIPDSVGGVLAGENWLVAREFVVPIGFWTAAAGSRLGAKAILRTLNDRKRILVVSAVSGLTLIVTVAAGSLGSAETAAWAFAVSYGLSLALWWGIAIRASNRAGLRSLRG